jgi:Fe-S cluster assembly protein SufD
VGIQAVQEQRLVEEISSLHEEPAWLREQRRAAWRFYEELPLPTGKEEEWRRADPSALSLDGVTLFAPAAPSARLPGGPREGRNGYGGQIVQHASRIIFQETTPELARQGVLFSDLHSAARRHPKLTQRFFMTDAVRPDEWKYVALHGALWSGGAFLYVPAGVEVSLPLRYAVGVDGAGRGVFPHLLIVAEAGSSVTCVDESLSPTRRGPGFSSAVVEIIAGEGARVRYVGLQGWGKNVNSFLTLRALLDKDSRLQLMAVGLGGRVSKARIEAVLRAPGAAAEIAGLTLADGDQRFDYGTLQDHIAPNTTSDLLFKSAMRDRARFAWYGLTRVHKGAGGSDANQVSRSLLLGDEARATPMPVLEIEAYDVARCSHGATVSSVDEEQLFYMMSRGVPRQEAAQAIVEGFFRQGLERLGSDGLRRGVVRALQRKLASRRG